MTLISALLSCSHKIIKMKPLWSSCLGKRDGELCCKGCEGIPRGPQRLGCQGWGPAQIQCSQGQPLPHGDSGERLPDALAGGAASSWGSFLGLARAAAPAPGILVGPTEPPPPPPRVDVPAWPFPTPRELLHTQVWGCPWLPPAFCPDLDTMVYIKLGSSWKDLLAVLQNKMEIICITPAIWQIYCKSLWVSHLLLTWFGQSKCHDNTICPNNVFCMWCICAKGNDEIGRKITAREHRFPLNEEKTIQEDFLKALLIS